MTLPRWLTGADSMPGSRQDVLWAWVTIALSLAVAAGYATIAFNWYFQFKLADRRESRVALGRLRGITFCCAALGAVFLVSDMSWGVWRLYDAALLALAFRTWSFVFRMRGLGLVDDRLARVAELEESAKKYREIAELLPYMVWTATADGEIDFSNQRWVEYAGDGRTWLEAVDPGERDQVLEWWGQVLQSREPATREVRLGGAAGYRTFVVKAAPIVRGDALKWLGGCADIEDQKLLAAEKEMQAKQKQFFLNALGHDLRAPLNNLALNAHLLKMSARDDEEVEIANLIVENAIAAGDLVTNLLEFAKVGAEHNALTDVSLPGMLRQIARRFRPVADGKGLYLRVAGDGDLELRTDRLKLERVVSNLVDNAVKYTEKGGVVIDVAAPGDRVAVRVCDTGIGVPEESVPYLFDEFYQVNNHERDRSKGFGMGLTICRRLARQLGGDVRLAHSGPGGSCFEVTIGCDSAGGRGRHDGAVRAYADPQEAPVCSA